MKRLAWAIAFCAAAFSSVGAAAMEWRDPLAAKNSEGNSMLRSGDPGAALESYKSAQVESPESPQLHHNIGLALSAQEKYEEAIQSFDSVFSSDVALKASAHYNKGFCEYRMAKQAEEAGDFQTALDQLQAAMESNRQSLKLTPNDEDAKFNYEQAKRAWKELYDKIKQDPDDSEQNEQNQDPQNQDPKNQDPESQDPQDQDGQDQDGQDPEPSGEEGEDRQNKQDQNASATPSPTPRSEAQPQEGSEDEQEQPQDGQPRQAEAGKLTEEQARRQLNQLEEENAEAFKNLFRPQGMPIQGWKNDW